MRNRRVPPDERKRILTDEFVNSMRRNVRLARQSKRRQWQEAAIEELREHGQELRTAGEAGPLCRLVREALGLSRPQLGEILGVSVTTILTWEKDGPPPSGSGKTLVTEFVDGHLDGIISGEIEMPEPREAGEK